MQPNASLRAFKKSIDIRTNEVRLYDIGISCIALLSVWLYIMMINSLYISRFVLLAKRESIVPCHLLLLLKLLLSFYFLFFFGLTLGEKGQIKEYCRFSKVMRSLSFLPLFFIKTAILLDVEFPLSLTFALEVCQFSPKDVWLFPSCRNKQDAIL